MTVKEFTAVLVEEMEVSESRAFVDTLKRDALSAITAGKGTIASLTASGVNGKTFNRAIELTPTQVLQACNAALKQYLDAGAGDDEVVATNPDFRGLVR